MDLKPGDIIAVRSSGLLSRLIVDFSGPISHVGLVTSLNPVLVTQALTTVETLTLDATLAPVKYAYALQPFNMSDVDRARIVSYVLNCVGEAYDYTDLGLQALDKLTGTTKFTQAYASSSKVICSELVARGYAKVNLCFGVSSRSATPTEIYEFAVSHPASYAVQKLK